MMHRLLMVVVLLLGGGLMQVQAQEPEGQWVESRFGVWLFLPDSWRLLTRDELSAVDDADAEQKLDLPQVMRERLSERVRGGGLELIFNTGDAQKGFFNNITLFETRDQVPEAAAQIKSTCGALPGLLSHTLGRSVMLDECRGLDLGGYPAFVLAYAGNAEQTRIVQYMLQLEQSRSLMLTLTYHEGQPAILSDFEQLVQRLRLIEPELPQ